MEVFYGKKSCKNVRKQQKASAEEKDSEIFHRRSKADSGRRYHISVTEEGSESSKRTFIYVRSLDNEEMTEAIKQIPH